MSDQDVDAQLKNTFVSETGSRRVIDPALDVTDDDVQFADAIRDYLCDGALGCGDLMFRAELCRAIARARAEGAIPTSVASMPVIAYRCSPGCSIKHLHVQES